MTTLLATLAQVAAVSPPMPSWSAMVQSAAALVVIGLQGWMVRVVRQARDETRAFRQHLFGLEGNNGMNSQVKSLERRVERHDEQLATHDKRLTVAEWALNINGEGGE